MITDAERAALIEQGTPLEPFFWRDGYRFFPVEAVENQRYLPLIGWGKRLLPSDVGVWSTWDCRRGFGARDELAAALSGGHGARKSDWLLLASAGETDADGWRYSVLLP